MKFETILKSAMMIGLLAGVAGTAVNAKEACDTVTLNARGAEGYNMSIGYTNCDGLPDRHQYVKAGDEKKIEVQHATTIEIEACALDDKDCSGKTSQALTPQEVKGDVEVKCYGEDYMGPRKANCMFPKEAMKK